MQRGVHASDARGFTLIELLIVILILGILATIVTLGVKGMSGRGDSEACQSLSKDAEKAALGYYTKTCGWPADVGTLVTSKYLKAAPKASYGITVNPGTGAVTDTCP